MESRDLRSEILQAARQLFSERGYHALSMREIAEAVRVSKAALYYHFIDKEELFVAILETYLAEMEAIIQRVRKGSSTTRACIQSLVGEILSQPAGQRAIIRLASQEMAQLSAPMRESLRQAFHQRCIARIDEILAEGMQRGELRLQDSRVAAWALLGIMYPYFYPPPGGEILLPASVVDQISAIFLDGVCDSRPAG